MMESADNLCKGFGVLLFHVYVCLDTLMYYFGITRLLSVWNLLIPNWGFFLN